MALVLRCLLCGLSFHWSMFLLPKGFIVGIEVRKKTWATHVVRSPSWTASPGKIVMRTSSRWTWLLEEVVERGGQFWIGRDGLNGTKLI